MSQNPFRALLLPIPAVLVAIAACGQGDPVPMADDPAEEAVRLAIQAHGGERFDRAEIEFVFRGARFLVQTRDGRFHYERRYQGPGGAQVREWMDNEGTGREIDGERRVLSEQERSRVETAVNSVVYFGFLPYRLLDPATHHRYLGTAQVRGEPYHKVEVTFEQEGGGTDWEDRFVYWFHQDDLTLDYLAYRYYRDGGGTRFRRAVNRRSVDGLLIQDYENFTAARELDDIAEYDRLLEEEGLQLLSRVELEEVEVRDPGEWDPSTTSADLPADEGIQLSLGMDRVTYSPGDTIQVTIWLTNRLDVLRTLEFSTAQRYDLEVITQEDEPVYSWAADRSFAQVMGSEELPPGMEGPRWEELVPAPDAPGEYRLRVVVPAQGTDLSAEVPLEVSMAEDETG